MADKVKFKVYRGTAFEIGHLPLEDGAVYFAYNTGEIFLDKYADKVVNKYILTEDLQVNNKKTYYILKNEATYEFEKVDSLDNNKLNQYYEDSGLTETRVVLQRFLMSAANSTGGSAGYVYAAADSDSIDGKAPTLIKENDQEYDNIDPYYFILRDGFPELETLPKVDTLIINMGVKNTGEFYRVIEVQGNRDRVRVQKIAAGSASGGGGNVKDLYLNLDDSLTTGVTLIYGQQQIFNISGRSDTAKSVSIHIYVKDEQHNTVIVDDIQTRKNDEIYQFDASILPLSNNITIKFSLTANGSMMPDKYKPNEEISQVKVVEMSLAKNSGFVTSSYFVGSPSLTFNVIGDSSSIIVTPHLLINGSEVHSSIHKLGNFALNSSTKTFIVPQQVHGVYDVEVYLTTNVGGIDLRTDSLTYQMAWVDTESDIPLIWLDNVPKKVINYDNLVIKYQVYNPVTEKKHQTTTINLLQENELISLITTSYDSNAWLEWDISSLYTIKGIDDTENHFAISCGAVRKDFKFIVTSTGARDLGLVNTNSLSLNLTSSGRSNKEDSFLRNIWSYKDINTNDVFNTHFINFNWFNNGWKDSGDGQGAYLSVANGASATIDFKPIEINSTSSTTFELRFRVRNIQEYSTLVTTIARYNVEEDSENAYTLDEIEKGYYAEVSSLNIDKIYYKANTINEITTYTKIETVDFVKNGEVITPNENNEFILIGTTTPIKLYENRKYTLKHDDDGNPIMNEKKSTKETISDKGVCFKYFDDAGYGFCIGTQEAFIKTRAGVANVRYKEDEIINLTFAIAGGDNAHNVYIYLNGILSGAIDLSTRGNQIETINASSFIINSEYCDFDLYKLRVYSTCLTMPEVIHNYLSDMRDINLYDQNQLTDPNDSTKLLYTKILSYNENIKEKNKLITGESSVKKYIQNLTMPYAVIQTIDNIASLHLSRPDNLGPVTSSDDDRLPYNKDGGDRYVKITFINPALDEALEKGIITEDFYYTHSPSYEAVGVDINVQGTSSQGYPRRNYKTKFKTTSKMPNGYLGKEEYAWGWRYLKGSKAGSKIKKWNMDNASCATNKFTWKIDYMESSGSYNTGFANLVGNNLYSKHPLQDYNFDNVDASEYRTSVYGFPVLVFHKHSQTDDLEKYSSEKESDLANIYTYIGRYNLNLDKSSNEFYGFEVEEEHPFVNHEWDEEVKNDDGSTAIVHHNHPLIANVAECWELRNNQGTWTSFKYPNAESRETGFGTLQDGNDQLEILNHFEVRYNPDEDAIEFASKLTNAELVEAQAVETGSQGDIDLSSTTKMKAFLRERYSNLETLFNWLDSTDTSVVPSTDTGIELSSVEKNRQFEDTIKYMVETVEIKDINNNIIKQTWFVDEHGNHIYQMPTAKDAQGNIIYNKDAQGYLLDDNNSREELDKCIAKDNYTGTVRNFNVLVSYNTDCAGYRLHKFKAEFTRHLSLEYCIIYFILTELLLCYDSRGKNMMLASWGPQELGGEYIWYPIFYDIDTQLGLNNIGAVLWDYNADATLDGNFSTANSVLWTNLWAAFRPSIEAKYRELRRGTKLTETSIEGAYLCDPEVFSDSYAMKGVRPIIALGLDEYYKYILPGLQLGDWERYQTTAPWKAVRYSGYIDAEKGECKTNTGYLYTCQGDRKLSRELLIRNRLNYLDSWWLAGTYVAEAVKGGIMIRANANDLNTSDIFLDENLVLEDVPNYHKASYPLKYFDATPKFEITPFLSQYVTVFYDEDPITPSQKYNGITPVITNTTPSVENGYKTIHPYNEQLTYIPGGDFISSLGDLSLKYPSHFTLGTGKRLVDLKLGSDIPGYRNNLLGSGDGTFNLMAGAKTANKKELLQKIILTGISGLTSTIDIVTTVKLREFRALGTNITDVTFAPGAPLSIVHLPATIQGLALSEAKNLTRILSTKPEVMRKVSGNEEDFTAEYEYKDSASYSGLYIESITDYSATNTSELKFTSLKLESDNLNYDSYKIMDNMIQWRIKDLNYNRDKPLAITLTGVDWCPYSLISTSAEPDVNIQYYRATDHGTFEEYTYSSEKLDEFIRLRRNEKLYILDEIKNQKKDYIQDLRYLDLFIADHTVNNENYNGINCRYRADNSSKYEIPNIQGILYVNNTEDNPILETDLDKEEGRYSLYFPNLTIFAKYITPSYIAKFIQEDDVGRENEFWLKRIATDSSDLIAPYPTEIPLKQNYDFVGWSLVPDCYDSNGNPIKEQLIITYDKITKTLNPADNYNTTCVFSEENSIITFYAIFELHKYQMVFYNNDNTTILTTEEYTFTTREGIDEPKVRPSKITNEELDKEKMYTWKGWAKKEDPALTPVDFEKIAPTDDFDFVAIYEETISDVHDEKNILDSKYFNITEINNNLSIGLNPDYIIQGKITIPNKINNNTVIQIGSVGSNFFLKSNSKNKITHVFFESEDCQIKTIGRDCFRGKDLYVFNSSLQYVEPIDSIELIDQNAFSYTTLPFDNLKDLLSISNLKTIGISSFYAINTPGICVLPGKAFDSIGNLAFGSFSRVTDLIIGSNIEPCEWDINTLGNNILQGISGLLGSGIPNSIKIYLSADKINNETYKNTLWTKLNLGNIVMETDNEEANYSWLKADN